MKSNRHMEIIEYYDENGKSLQEIMEQFFEDYCIEIGIDLENEIQ